MPIIETVEPQRPEELQHRIFATKKGEDHIIIQAVCEHVRSHSFQSLFTCLPTYRSRPPSHRECKRVRAEAIQLDREGYETFVVQTETKAKDVKFDAEKALIFLIMGSFMLADGKVIGEEGVKMGDLMGKIGAGKGYLVEWEEGCRVFPGSCVCIGLFD